MSVTSAVSAEPKIAAPPMPYVGLRPFEREERDRFRGRDRDAQILTDRVLSGRVTILYAQSGLGKSSLLRALVIPNVEQDQANVIYFDSWSQEDPLRALKDSLVALATKLGVHDAGRGSPTLAELARLISAANDRTFVLVLDQFEEFLVRHSQDLDPLRDELATLVRAPRLDASVLISLREEFLAALEPFRQYVLNLFQSTYRLEPLSDDALREAIMIPPQLFGGSCETELADRLIKDLRAKTNSEKGADESAFQPAVELPMLQLVCQELWKRSPDGKLTLASYEEMGGKGPILDAYVRGLMPKGWLKQNLTARLLVYLAPPSGLKMSYSIQDLASATGLGSNRIGAELERLGKARILRTREYRSGVRYELEHDAFIPVLQSWRDPILNRRRQFTTFRRAAYAVLVVVAVSTSVLWQHRTRAAEREREQSIKLQRANEKLTAAGKQLQLYEQWKKSELGRLQAEQSRFQAEQLAQQAEKSRLELEQWQTGGLLSELKHPSGNMTGWRERVAGPRFDMVTTYLLWGKGQGDIGAFQKAKRFDQLKGVLTQNVNLLPADYGVETPTPEIKEETQKNPGENWPLQIEYSPDRHLDRALFETRWRNLAKLVTSDWGIPIPFEVRLVENKDVPKDKIRVVGAGRDAVDLNVPIENELLVRSRPEQLQSSAARDFLEKYQTNWKPMPSNEGWRLIPAWSIPVWKMAGATPIRPSGIDAQVVMQQLVYQKPGPLLSGPAVEVLLNHLSASYPVTVAEARAARGTDLPSDLSARVAKNSDALLHLPEILDELASQPAASEAEPSANAELTKKLRELTANAQPSKSATDQKKDTAKLWGPWPKPAAGAAGESAPAPETQERVDDWQLESMRIKQNLPQQYAPVHVAVSRNYIPGWFPYGQLSAELKERLADVKQQLYRRYGIIPPYYLFDDSETDANTIKFEAQTEPPRDIQLKIQGPDTLQVLAEDLYSATEQTRTLWVTPETIQDMLRRLPQSSRDWLASKYSVTDLKRLLRAVLAENVQRSSDMPNIRYGAWLLNSLCFWGLTSDASNLSTLRDRLLATEAARHQLPGAENGSSSQARTFVENGIEDLLTDKDASGDFGNAIKQDPDAAAKAFLSLWAEHLPEIWARTTPRSTVDSDLKGEDLIDFEDLTGSLNPKHFYSPEDRFLAIQLLKEYDPLHPRRPELEQSARELITDAIPKLVDQKEAHDIYLSLLKLTNTPTPNWAWQFLDELATARPGGPSNNLPVELAWQMCKQERADRLNRALSLIGGFEKIYPSADLSADDKALDAEIVDYVKANAYMGLANLGDEKLFAEAERRFRSHLDSKYEGISENAYLSVIQMSYEFNRNSEAEELNKKAIEKWPTEADFLSLEMFDRLIARDKRGVKSIVDDSREKADQANGQTDVSGWRFIAALGSTLAQSADAPALLGQYLTTDHDYKDYVRLIGAAFAVDEAESKNLKRGIDERWKHIDPSTWGARMKAGDVMAWREMLLGRFEHARQSSKLFDIIEDEHAWQDSDFAGLPMSRRGQRCEAWFYEAMRAKAEGDIARMRDCLKRCIDTNFRNYYEYRMAQYILGQSAELSASRGASFQ